MDPQLVEDFLRTQCQVVDGELRNRSTGRRVSAIMPVHVLGHPVNLDALEALAQEFGLRLLEDAAESLGASWGERRIGNTADIACVSLNGNKTITCGGGGMILTNRREDADRARYLTTQAKDDAVEYIHNEIGFNYRMTNVLAAIGLAQLEQLDGFVNRRREIAAFYRSQLSLPGMTWHTDAPGACSTSWLSTVLIDPLQSGITAVQLRNQLQQARIQTRRLWQPMHLSPAHAGCQAVVNGTADRLFAQALSFPSTPNLQAADLQRIVSSVMQILPAAAQVPARRAA
ncbi:MAG: DegT/DnrJ/EryC1/StrS family aminotransferase, partial [Planctomycetaceae bacterium]